MEDTIPDEFLEKSIARLTKNVERQKQHCEILEQGVDSWNSWRLANPEVTPDLHQLDLSNKNLEGINLACADLRMTYLKGTNLRGADLRNICRHRLSVGLTYVSPFSFPFALSFSGADITGANLSGADLREAKFENAILRRVTAIGAHFDNVSLVGVDLSDSNVSRSSFKNAELCNANLTGLLAERARFNHCNLTGAQLDHARLELANLRGANIENASLRHCLLNGAFLNASRLINADLTLANVEQVVVDDETIMASLRGVPIRPTLGIRNAKTNGELISPDIAMEMFHQSADSISRRIPRAMKNNVSVNGNNNIIQQASPRGSIETKASEDILSTIIRNIRKYLGL